MKKDKKIKIFLGLVYLLIVIIFLWLIFKNFSLNELTSYDFIKNNRDYLITAKENNYFMVSVFFLIFSIIWILLLGFASRVFLIGGFIFGKWMGTILVAFGLSIGATIVYIIANYFFRDLIEDKFSKKFINLKDKFDKNEFLFFLIYRLIGGIPFAISNFLPTLFNVKIKNFFFGSLIGLTPQLFIGASIGSGIENVVNMNEELPSYFSLLLNRDIYIPIIFFILFIIISFLLRKKIYKN